MNKALSQLETWKAACEVVALNVLHLNAAVADGDTVTIGSRTYECDDKSGVHIEAGRVRVPVFNGYANATLNFDDTQNVVDGNTVTVGTKIYTFKAVLSNVDGYVRIGPTIARSIYNLVAAVNVGYPNLIEVPACYGELNDVGEGAGVAYAAATTRNPADINAMFGGDFDLQIVHWPGGMAGNTIALASTLIGNSGWADGEFVNPVPAPTNAQFGAALVTAINNDLLSPVLAEQVGAAEVLLWSRRPGDVQLACESVFTDGDNYFEEPTLLNGLASSDALPPLAAVRRIVKLHEDELQRIHFVFAFEPSGAVVQFRQATGEHVGFDGRVVIAGRRVTITGGETGFFEGQICNLIAFK